MTSCTNGCELTQEKLQFMESFSTSSNDLQVIFRLFFTRSSSLLRLGRAIARTRPKMSWECFSSHIQICSLGCFSFASLFCDMKRCNPEEVLLPVWCK